MKFTCAACFSEGSLRLKLCAALAAVENALPASRQMERDRRNREQETERERERIKIHKHTHTHTQTKKKKTTSVTSNTNRKREETGAPTMNPDTPDWPMKCTLHVGPDATNPIAHGFWNFEGTSCASHGPTFKHPKIMIQRLKRLLPKWDLVTTSSWA